jgi:predicted DNA-binding protein YlxM (UPF0122 family)
VLAAFYFDGRSVREIAEDQRTSERAVEGRLRRARAKLRKKLERIVKPAAELRDSAIRERTDHARQTPTP